MRSVLGRASVSLVLGALLLLAGSAFAATPKPGQYSGTSEQGHPITFEVKKKGEKRRVRDFGYAVEAPCDSGGPPVQAGGTLMSSEKVSNKGKFSYSEVSSFSLEVRGKFTSKTRAKGTLHYAILTGGGTNYCDSGTVSWEAERD